MYVENDRVTSPPNRVTQNKDYQGFWRKGATGADFEHLNVLPNFTMRAVQYVSARAREKKPFFLYLPLPAPHTPILPLKEYEGKSGTNPYGDFVLQVDDTIGQVMKAVEVAGIAQNTLFIVTADNGCSPRARFEELAEFGHDPSYVFRGHKADIFEGGHRVPFVARWPARVNIWVRQLFKNLKSLRFGNDTIYCTTAVARFARRSTHARRRKSTATPVSAVPSDRQNAN